MGRKEDRIREDLIARKQTAGSEKTDTSFRTRDCRKGREV